MQVGQPPPTPPRTPLGGQHHQVERVHRLHLQPGGPPPAGLIGRRRVLGEHPFVALRQHPAVEGRGSGRAVGDQAGHQERVSDHAPEGGGPLLARPVDEVFPVEVQAVEEERGQRDVEALLLGLPSAAEAAHGGLEGERGTARVQRHRLPVENDGLHREGRHRLDHLGHPGGYLPQAPGVHRHPAALPVHLDPSPVHLGLQGDPPQPGEGLVHPRGGLGQHRQERAEQRQPQAAQAALPGFQGRPGHLAQVAGHHEGPAHLLGRQARRGRHCLDDQTPQRPLAKVPHDERPEELLLGLRGRPQQLLQQPCPLPLASRAGDIRYPPEQPVGVAQRQKGRERRRWGRGGAQHAPAHADATRRQLAGQERCPDGHLGGLHGPQTPREEADLGRAGAGGPHLPPGIREIGEEHHPESRRPVAKGGR